MGLVSFVSSKKIVHFVLSDVAILISDAANFDINWFETFTMET